MKKLILSGLIACLLAPMFSLTWNGLFDNTTNLSSNDDFSALTLEQSNGVHLSVNAPFNSTGTLKFVAEGSFKYKLKTDFNATTNNSIIADLDLFKFAGKWTVGKGIIAAVSGGSALGKINQSPSVTVNAADQKSIYIGLK
jgi:hypothetical protein